jgi:uncharacterized protein with von Willebrand factor type A (vWA) domain
MHVRYQHLDEDLLRQALNLPSLRRLYLELLFRNGGDAEHALRWLRHLWKRHGLDEIMPFPEFEEHLRGRRLIAANPETGRHQLTRLGERTLRRESLLQIFGGLAAGAVGEHPTPRAGRLGDRLAETRPYQFGDPVSDIDFGTSIRKALRRHPELEQLKVTSDDLEVFETEHLTSCATVLLVDISHSMTLYGEDRITPARKVALALAELIHTRFSKDTLDVAVFGDEATRIPIRTLPYLTNGPFHTNTRAGLQLAQRMLRRRKHPNRQIFMITDGKPSCMDLDGEHYRCSWGLDPAIVARTLEEAAACRRAGIVISTFQLARDPELVEFVERLTEVNHGRAYLADPANLGQYILVDFLRNRRRRVR